MRVCDFTKKPYRSIAIVRHIGNLSESSRGWTKELNIISWNGGVPKLDIRDWAPEHEKMGKGITLSKEEAEKLARLLQKLQK